MIDTRGDTDRAVGTQLQSLRIYAGLDLEQAAQRLGLRQIDLLAYEAGIARPSAATLLAMADCYAAAPSEVFAIAAASRRA